MQKLHQYMNCLPTNAGLPHIFIRFKFDKDAHSQCECPLSNWSQKGRNLFDLPNFDCMNDLMTPQGLIDHFYAIAFGKKPFVYHMATYYYIHQMHDGKTDVEQVNEIFSPKNSISCFKEFTVEK